MWVSETVLLIAIVGGLSVVQSIFGMGVLVFGTPTLLLLGHDFPQTLSLLVPASIVISALQVAMSRNRWAMVPSNLLLFCLPAIGIGLTLALEIQVSNLAPYLIGAMLLMTSLVRLSHQARHRLSRTVERHERLYHIAMGLVHGLTNLGGALLVVLASAKHRRKQDIRQTVATYYLAFGILQVLILVWLGAFDTSLETTLILGVTAALAFLAVGNTVFQNVSSNAFDVALTAFIAVYGLVVLLNVAGEDLF